LPRRWFYCSLSSLLILTLLTTVTSAAKVSDMSILEGREPVVGLAGLGAWSSGDGDYRVNLAGGWQARRSDGGEIGGVDLPFCWDGWKGELKLTRTFFLPDSFRNRSYRLVVERFAEYIAVKLNNAHLDTRRGDGLSFQLALNPGQLHFGSVQNEIELTLDNRLSRKGTVPLSGGIYARRRYGGIHQDIYLVSSPLVSISDMVVRFIEAGADSGSELEVNAELRQMFHPGEDSTAGGVRVEFTLLDQSGNSIASSRLDNIEFPPGGVLRLTSLMPAEGLVRWGIFTSPWLYRLRGSIITSNTRHSLETRFGARSLKLTPDGFILNGQGLQLRCISYPEVRPGHGALTDPEQLEADVVKMKELGVHAVRILQGSASTAFLDICDRYGLLVFEEIPIFQAPDPILSDPELIRSASEQLEAVIRRDGRFTCIAGWGIGSQINPPDGSNQSYYRQLTQLVHDLDERPVYASFPFKNRFTAAPLDFAILELTPFSGAEEPAGIGAISGDRPFMIGGIRRAVQPGNLGGYADPASEVGQADYLLNMIRQGEKVPGCVGIVVGDFTDWEGVVPSISSPLKGQSNLYTTGICDSSGNPRLAYHRIREYWASGRVQPLARGERPHQDSGLIIAVGLGLIIILFVAIRRNNLLKFNLGRTFTSPKGFFHDIGDRRYAQSGQTLLVAVLISGGFGLLGAGWFFDNRRDYTMDWLLGYLMGDSELLRWTASLVWQPTRALAFFSVLVFILIWLASIRTVLLCKILGKPCSLVQGIAYVTWASAGYLCLLPVGMLSERLFDASIGWLVLAILILLSAWSHQRLMSIIMQHARRSMAVVNVLWFIGPVVLLIILFVGFEYTRQITDYWGFFWETIV